MKPILIIKTGITVQKAFAREGDFEQWIMDSMQASASEFCVVEVFKNEKLPALESLAAVVITGSPAMVTDRLDWSEYTAHWLREAVKQRVPTLGICYGHQLLAHALGGVVGIHPQGREIGTVEIELLDEAKNDELFAAIATPFYANVSHMQSVITLPEGARALGKNDFEAHQIVKFAEQVWGLQFHPEFSEIAMRAYIEERKKNLTEEGLDVESLLSAVKPTPVSRNIMVDFYKLVRSYSV